MLYTGLGSHSLSYSSPLPNNKPHGFCGHKSPRKKKCEELRNCVNREVGLGSHSLAYSSPIPNIVMSQMVSADVIVNHHERRRLCAELKSCMYREVGLGSHSLSPCSPVPNNSNKP